MKTRPSKRTTVLRRVVVLTDALEPKCCHKLCPFMEYDGGERRHYCALGRRHCLHSSWKRLRRTPICERGEVRRKRHEQKVGTLS